MKYACSLEMVNMLTSGPGAFTRQSKKFWIDYMKFIAAAGFSGIELPFNCFSSDAMAFETGRSGIPCNAAAIQEKYGGAEAFIGFLSDIGIADGVIDVHVSLQDAMLEVLASGEEPEKYYELAERLLLEALNHAEGLRAGCLVISPSPELGWLYRVFGEDLAAFEEKTCGILERIAGAGKEKKIRAAVKNEYWSYFRGEKRDEFLSRIPELYFAPDPAHLIIEGAEPADTIASFKDRIVCARINDTAFADTVGNWKRINAELPVEGAQRVFADCGEGIVNHKEYLSAMKKTGYDGRIICENRKTLDVYKGLLKLGWFVQHELKNA